MKYLKNYKWTWDLVSPSLKAKFQYLYNLEMVNRANALANSARIPGLKSDIQQRLNDLQNLRQKILREKQSTSNAIDNYTGVEGRGEGIDYAYRTGKYAQILKASVPEYNKVIPHDDLTLFRIASNKNDSKLTSPKSQYNENDTLGVATDTGKFYKRNGSSYSEYTDYELPEDMIGLYRTFILDPEDNSFYYFWNPWKWVYLWSDKGPGVKEEDKPQQSTPTPTPDDPDPADPDPSDPSSSDTYIIRIGRWIKCGDHCYTDNGENFVNNPTTIDFDMDWSGNSNVTVTLIGDMTGDPYYLQMKQRLAHTALMSLSHEIKSGGSVGLTLDRAANPRHIEASDFIFKVNDSGDYWSRTFTFPGLYFTQGSHYVQVCTNCSRWNHLYVTYIQINIDPI